MSAQPPQPDRESDAANEATRFSSLDDSGRLEELDFDLLEPNLASGTGQIGVLGEYVLLEQIGSGGMGRVYRAEHRTMNRDVALKVLSSDIAERPNLLAQFFAEIRAVAKLMHPNIVTAFDAGTIGNTHYLVMELVDGQVLSSRVREHGPLTGSEATNILEQAARALAYAHQQGIVHRDIKPGNMMVTNDGTLKILDFGLARLGKSGSTLVPKNIFMGTPEYMSPEQIENADSVDGRSDLYSLGATLFFLLTGRAMFNGDKMHVAAAQIRQKPEPLYIARGDIDLRLDAIFQKLVAKPAADRHASAEDLLANLESLNLTSRPAKVGGLLKGAGRLGGEHSTSAVFSQSTLAKKSQIVAIDLGMLISTAAHYDAHLGPRIIHQGEGNSQHLRNMLWSRDKQIKIGTEAVTMRQSDPERVIHSIQRWIGAREVAWQLGGRRVPPEVILASLLRQIMWNAAATTDRSDTAIITVPGCYDQMHRRAIRTACHIAGINLVQLLDKSLAAALSWLDLNSRLSSLHASQTAINAKLLFVHLGGTGLESSIVHACGLEARQLGVSGSWKLGSLRWQSRLAEFFAARLKEQCGQSIRDDIAAATRLQRTVELALDRLTRSSKVEVRFDWKGASIQQSITQEGLVKVVPELTKSIEDAIAGACQNANTDIGEIDHILLAGSMFKMKPLQDIVKRCVPHAVPLTTLEHADLACGASIQSQHYSSLVQSDRLHPRAVGCTAYNIALYATDPATGKAKPGILVGKSSILPAAVTRTLRPSASPAGNPPSFPTLQIIESTSLGEANWLRLGRAKPDELFPDLNPGDPLQLRLEVDESGVLDTSLLWPAGNRQVRLPHTSDPTLADQQITEWRSWLDTTLLCSGS